MTVDSALRAIWRKDMDQLKARLFAIEQKLASLELTVQTTHPGGAKIELPQHPADPALSEPLGLSLRA